jgi:putative ABC transport system permease protein
MFKNFLLITLRNLLRDKVFLVLNLLGLSLGIAGSILIMLYVRHELSYDKFHPNTAGIYRINTKGRMEGKEISVSVSAPPQARVFKEEFPEIIDATRFYYPEERKVTSDQVTYHEKRFFYADPNFLEMFNFPLLKGNPKTALQNPNSVILTEEIASKLFGNSDPIGKNIIIDNDQILQVTGVARNVPDNTHFRFDYLASLNTLDFSTSEIWLILNVETYIQLPEDYPADSLEAKLELLMDKYVIPQVHQFLRIKATTYKDFKASGNEYRYLLQPLADMHLDSEFRLGYEQGTNKVYIYFFSIVAIFLLFIACINFMNLSTAKYAFRSKEVGIKKVVGSTRGQLIRQFLTESMIITVIAVIIALTMVELILPYFRLFTGKNLEIGYLSHWYAIPSLVALTLFVGISSGSYPAFYLSSFRPAEIIQSKTNNGTGKIQLRSVLVVVQFTITIILLISTFIVSSQNRFIRKKELGFSKENILVVRNTGDLGEQAESFRQQVLQIPGVKNASRSWTIPGEGFGVSALQIQGDSLMRLFSFEMVNGDHDFINTLGINVNEGRTFSREYAADYQNILVNKKAAITLGLKQPLGTRLLVPNDTGGQDVREIIGVFDDVNYKTIHQKIEPMLIGLNTDNSLQYTIIKLGNEDIEHTMQQIEKTWNGFIPEQAIEYFFLDENFDNLYRAEIKAGRIFSVFSVLSIFVTCLGLLGLSAFTAIKRTKEIGIRKVHGASVPIILRLLSRETIVLITVSSVIAWPIVYYIMHRWLQNFAYRTSISPWIFLLSTCIGLVIALVVVIYQSLRAAHINPVEALKYE